MGCEHCATGQRRVGTAGVGSREQGAIAECVRAWSVSGRTLGVGVGANDAGARKLGAGARTLDVGARKLGPGGRILGGGAGSRQGRARGGEQDKAGSKAVRGKRKEPPKAGSREPESKAKGGAVSGKGQG